MVAAEAERSGSTSRSRLGDATHRPPLDQACHTLLEIVRRRCPGLLPSEPLAPGVPAEPVPIEPDEAVALVKVAARQAALAAAGLPTPPNDDQLPEIVLWHDGVDELLVEVGAVGMALGDGTIAVTVPVRCEEIVRKRATIRVEFAVGSPQRPTGLLASTTEPLGPPVVVLRWGDALTALAWHAVLDTVGGVSAATGEDADGSPLIPVALTASRTGLAVQAQARHPIDRILSGRVVLGSSAPRAAGP